MTGTDEKTKRWVHYYVPSDSADEGDSEARRSLAYTATRARGIIPYSLDYVKERPPGYDPMTGLPDAAVRKKLALANFKWGVRCFVGCLPSLLCFLAVLVAFAMFMAWISPPGSGLSPSDRQWRDRQLRDIQRGAR